MVTEKVLQTWELWYPGAAASGLPIARARIDPTAVVWAHSLPRRVTVLVRQGDDGLTARGEGLERSGQRYPMTRLWIEGDRIHREDRWPSEADLGSIVILPGGEAGVLLAWWNAEDGSEWRWQTEFYNHR